MHSDSYQRLSQESSDKTQISTISLFNITNAGVTILLERRLDINCLFVLFQFHTGVPTNLQDTRIASWHQTLIRKKLLTIEDTVTLAGRHLLEEVAAGIANDPIKMEKANDPFEKWWSEAYPDTDHFELDGRVFIGQQKKHMEKEKSRLLYWEIINEGAVDHDDIYWATVSLVENAKARSLVNGKSEITFIPNSKRFLELRCFTPFIAVGRKRKANTQTSNPYDFNI